MKLLGFLLGLLAVFFAVSADAVTDKAWAVFSKGEQRLLGVRQNNGHIIIRGTAAGDTVRVTARRLDIVEEEYHEGYRDDPRAKGLRRITAAATGLSIWNDDTGMLVKTNELSGRIELVIDVPRDVALDVRSTFCDSIYITGMTGFVSVGSENVIHIANVTGDIEAETGNGWIFLDDIRGSVVANTHFGGIEATFTALDPEKPVSLSGMDVIDVALPKNVKATLHMKSTWGEIFTDFDVKMLPRESRSGKMPLAPLAPLAPRPALTGDQTKRLREAQRREKDLASARELVGRAVVAPGGEGSALQGLVNGGGTEVRLTTASGNIYVRKR